MRKVHVLRFKDNKDACKAISFFKNLILQFGQECKYIDKYCHHSIIKPLIDISSSYSDALRKKVSTTVGVRQG